MVIIAELGWIAYLRASNNSDIQKRGFKVYMSQKVQ